MDTKNSFNSIDDLLTESLQISGRPNARMVAQLKDKLRKEEVIMKKSPRRFLSTVAIAAALLVILTTSAIAAGWYFGAFERLEEIIGSEQANILHPVEVGTVIEENGFRAEIVAVGVFYNIVDVYLTLQDLEGDRLDGDMFGGGLGSWHLSYFITATEDVPETRQDALRIMSSPPPEIINRCENGIITMHLRSTFNYEIIDSQLTFNLHDITVTTFFDENYNTGLDLQALVQANPQTMHFTSEQVTGARLMGTRWGASDSYFMHHAGDVANMFPDGINVLEPHQHNIPVVDVDGVEMYVSSIGIIDGRLHIQLYNPDPVRGPALFTLRDSNMNHVPMYKILGFSMDETCDNSRWAVVYSEGIFEIDLDRLDEYHLVAFVSTWESFEFSWEVALVVENYGHIAAEFEMDYDPGRVILYEVRVNPVSVRIYGGLLELRGQGGGTYDEHGRFIPDNPNYYTSSGVGIWPGLYGAWPPFDGVGRAVPIPVVRLHTLDGVIETTPTDYMRPGSSEFYLTFIVNGVLDLDTIVAVEINGEMVYF